MFINKSNLKSIVIVLLFILTFISGVYVASMELNTIHLVVTVVNGGRVVPGVNVYVFAITPNGTRFVKSASTNQYGIAAFELLIRDVINPLISWNQAEKRNFTLNPGLYITAFGKYNNTLYFGTGSVKLPLTTIGPIFKSITINLEHKISNVESKLGMYYARQQAPPWAKLIYTEQKTMRETFFKVVTDQNTKASCGYLAARNREAAFRCTFSISLAADDSIKLPWSIGAEISWVVSQVEGYLTLNVAQNSVGYVSCLVAINYECWEYEEPAEGGDLYLEHRVYIVYYWPDSLQTIKGDDDIEGNQIFLESALGKGWDKPVTSVYLNAEVSQEFDIPIFTFIVGIKFPKLPLALRVPIDIDLVFKDVYFIDPYAINADVRVYGAQGVTINIYYIKVYRTLNAYYQLPAWVIILKT